MVIKANLILDKIRLKISFKTWPIHGHFFVFHELRLAKEPTGGPSSCGFILPNLSRSFKIENLITELFKSALLVL